MVGVSGLKGIGSFHFIDAFFVFCFSLSSKVGKGGILFVLFLLLDFFFFYWIPTDENKDIPHRKGVNTSGDSPDEKCFNPETFCKWEDILDRREPGARGN